MKWPMVKLGDFTEKVDYGLTASAKENAYGPKFLRITDMQDDSVDWSTVPSCDCTEKELKDNFLSSGDIVFARTGATTGKSYLIRELPFPTVFASYLIRVRPSDDLDSKYLSYFFKSPIYWHQISTMANGAAQPGVNSSKLKELLVPLPPLEEQKRIAAILDKADAIRRKRQQAIDLADEFLRSVFLDMFGDPVTNPKGWEVVSLEDISDIQGGLQVSSKREVNPVNVPYLRVANVLRDELNLSEIKQIKVTDSELKRTRLLAGDILIVEGHGNQEEIGRSAVWDTSIDNIVHQNHLIRVRPDSNKVLSVFLNDFINSSGGRTQMANASNTTSGLNTISTGIVKSTMSILPPLSFQEEYEKTVSKIRSLKKEMCHRMSHDNKYFFEALSQKAFTGEL